MENPMNENPQIPPPESGPGEQSSVPTPPPPAPEAPPIAATPEVPPVVLTPDAQRSLNQTGPWVRYLSIMLFIGAGFLIFVGACMVLVGLIGLDSPMSSMGSGSLPNGAVFLLGPIYIVMALLFYVAPGIFLFRYASAIKALKTIPSSQALEDALKNQKIFWRYVGITTIVMLCILVLTVMAAIFFAVILSLRR